MLQLLREARAQLAGFVAGDPARLDELAPEMRGVQDIYCSPLHLYGLGRAAGEHMDTGVVFQQVGGGDLQAGFLPRFAQGCLRRELTVQCGTTRKLPARGDVLHQQHALARTHDADRCSAGQLGHEQECCEQHTSQRGGEGREGWKGHGTAA